MIVDDRKNQIANTPLLPADVARQQKKPFKAPMPRKSSDIVQSDLLGGSNKKDKKPKPVEVKAEEQKEERKEEKLEGDKFSSSKGRFSNVVWFLSNSNDF